jgi:soluble lytic murein transglycosylase-like protein
MQKWKYVMGVMALATTCTWGYFEMKTRSEEPVKLVSPNVDPAMLVTISPIATPSMVLSLATEASPSATPYIQKTIASASAIKKPGPTPTKIPTPTAEPSAEVNKHIERFSAQFGIDNNVLRHVAVCESGFRSNAINGPYVGLFQFGSTTWVNIRKEIGEDPNPQLRFSAKDAVQTAAYAISKGKGRLWPNCFPK